MFKLRQDVQEVQLRHALLDNSLTVKVGDIVAPTADGDIVSNSTALTAGDKYVLGLVVGFCKQNGEVIGQGQDPSNTPNQLATDADNTTGDKYHALYVPITPEMEFSATLSDTAGTTTYSDKSFVWFNLSDCRTLDETSVLVANDESAPLQVFSFGLDPEDTDNETVICRFAKSVMSRP